MLNLKSLAWLGCYALLITLSGCGESNERIAEKNRGDVDILETHIQPMSIEDDSVQTRYGKVDIARSAPDMPPDTLTLDGKAVFRDEGFFVSLQSYIQQDERDLVLFGSNCGGSGCPESHFQFLILNQDAKPLLVSQADFYALPDDLSIKTDEGKILLDLGFEAGKHKSAVLAGNNLTIVLKAAPKEYLGAEKCQWLHTDALNACMEYHDIDPQCAEPQSEFAGYLMRGVAGMADFPGFGTEAFERHCSTACKSGQKASFDNFAREVCSKQ